MNEVVHAAATVQSVCDAHGWRHCFIGGLAVLRWGEPRETVDVDLTLLTGFVDEERYITTLLNEFTPRIDDAAAFALAHRVLLLRTPSGVGVDVALGGMPFEEQAVERATLFTFPPDVSLRVCSAEDLVVYKVFADRPKDWIDVEGVVIRHESNLDWNYIHDQLQPLLELKETPELLDRLVQLRATLATRP